MRSREDVERKPWRMQYLECFCVTGARVGNVLQQYENDVNGMICFPVNHVVSTCSE